MGRKFANLISARFEGPEILVTLTRAPADGLGFAELASEAVTAFGRLRTYKVWKDHVRGGFFVVHVAGDEWLHPHIHAVIDAEFMPQSGLAESWAKALRGGRRGGGSAGVGARIEAVDDLDRITRYALHSADVDKASEEELESVVRWMHRRRLVQTFGTLHSAVVSDPGPVRSRGPTGTGAQRDRSTFNSATGERVPALWRRWQRSEAAEAEVAGLLRGRRSRVRSELPDAAPDTPAASAGARRYEIHP